METETDKLTYVIAERNYVRCITDGVKMGVNNLGNLLRYVWPALLAVCVSSGLWAIVQQMPATSDLYAISVIALLIVTLLVYLLYAGTVDAMIVRWRDLGYEPEVSMKTLFPLIRKRALRASSILLILVLVSLLSAGCTMVAMMKAWPLWTIPVALFVIVILYIPAEMTIMEVSYSDKSLGRCFASYLRGWRYFGRLFAFDVIGYICIALLATFPLLPLIVIEMVNAKATQAQAIGDLVDLPSYYPALAVFANVLSTAVTMILLTVWSHAHALMWGSIEEASLSQIKEQQETELSN